MDDIVRQAIAKWPHVPACYGWLGLDARGRWYMRDDATQAQGPFPQARGSLLQHEKLIDFIQRNYEADAQGRWYFQNGPQRVFVALEATPYVWRVESDFSLQAHTGLRARARSSLLDAEGRLYLVAESGAVGLVHTQDMVVAAEAVERGLWQPDAVRADDLPGRFGFVRQPRAEDSAAP